MARWTKPLDRIFGGRIIDVSIARGPGRPTRQEMLGWLMDADRPGVFAYTRVNGLGTMLFHISDPGVAFEFKMRFG